MTMTKQTVAEKIVSYLRHDISLADLVSWAEEAMMDGEFDEHEAATISDVVSRLGVADVRAWSWPTGKKKPTLVSSTCGALGSGLSRPL